MVPDFDPRKILLRARKRFLPPGQPEASEQRTVSRGQVFRVADGGTAKDLIERGLAEPVPPRPSKADVIAATAEAQHQREAMAAERREE